MGFDGADLCLLTAVTIFVVADILLALCLRLVLPEYMTQEGFYPADDRKVKFEDAVKFCPCLARVYPEGTNKPITFEMVKEQVTKKKREIRNDTIEQLNVYPFIVSLNILAYKDDPEEKLFACNGLIQSSEWVMTTKTCVKTKSEWHNLTVRSGSIYWSQMGDEHSVINVSDFSEDLVALKVAPKFSARLIPNAPIIYPYDGDWIHAVSLGWDEDMYLKKSSFRYKYKPFDVREWTSSNCNSEPTKVCDNRPTNCKMLSKPLVTSCHQLVGMKLDDSSKCNVFYNFGSKIQKVKKKKKSCYNIYKNICNSTKMEVCQKF
ncbi:hypothetical protein BDFB_010259 [Asbolus verrucosus]|uniref:Trypsin domain containing protein n=1 Tax=Asbolus verrucosus TaxID=1661398 RepID=A0A482VI87_ASBVE|nr:hypothetical protein BDFB_010259 [Asbolus verrucosus]